MACELQDDLFPFSLTGCKISGRGFAHPIEFPKGKLVSIGSKATYFHYGTITNDSQGDFPSNTSASLIFVPVGNAIGNFDCTVRHDLKLDKKESSNADQTVYSLTDIKTSETCSSVNGAAPSPVIERFKAVLVCPREKLIWDPDRPVDRGILD